MLKYAMLSFAMTSGLASDFDKFKNHHNAAPGAKILRYAMLKYAMLSFAMTSGLASGF